jgi:hypothetical protein
MRLNLRIIAIAVIALSVIYSGLKAQASLNAVPSQTERENRLLAIKDENANPPSLQTASAENANTAQNTGTTKAEPIRVAPNQSEIIKLERDAVSIVVTNPEHARVLLDNPRTLIIVPNLPGATSFKVMDHAGDVIFERDIIVSQPKRDYMRIRRLCANGESSCTQNQAVYYCPDGCYEVRTPSEDEAATPTAVEEPLGNPAAMQNLDDEGAPALSASSPASPPDLPADAINDIPPNASPEPEGDQDEPVTETTP